MAAGAVAEGEAVGAGAGAGAPAVDLFAPACGVCGRMLEAVGVCGGWRSAQMIIASSGTAPACACLGGGRGPLPRSQQDLALVALEPPNRSCTGAPTA